MILVGLALIYLVGSWGSVGTGTAMIKVSQLTGAISQPIVGPSSNFFFNGFARIVGLEYPVYIPYQRTAENTLAMLSQDIDRTADYPSVSCFSKDQLEMQIDIYLRWELDTSKLVQLYRNYPTLNWKNVIASIAREQMRIITSTKYTAVETIERRDAVRQEIMDAIISKLSAEPSLVNAVINIEFELRNIGYPAEYTQSIEAKLASEQQMKQAEFDAKKVIILAQADAEKVLIAAQAQANATVIKSMGISDAITFIANQTGVPEADIVKLYLWLDTLQQLEKPTFVMFLGQDGVPVLIPINP